jgi:arylesterase / paraoxonase
MRFRTIVIVFLVLVAAVAAFVVRTLYLAGTFRSIEPHFAGTCRLIEGPVGPEDLTIHPRTGVAYVSASDRRAVAAGKPVPGAIYSYDTNVEDAVPVNLTPDAGVSFQPHGISLWSGGDGPDVLFVINHPPAGTGFPTNTVEIFDVEPDRLVHRATLTDPQLIMPNDLVAVGPDRFYLTNTHGNRPGLWQTIETYLQLGRAKVLYYDARGFRPVLEGQVLPNGINVSRDGRTLYVASTTLRSLLVYDRDPATGNLTPRDTVFLGSGPDNIEVDDEGALWIGAHPKLLRIVAYRDDPTALPPSQVLRVEPKADGKWDVREIYLNDGTEIAGASVATAHGKHLFIGQIYANGFLDCTMVEGSRP